MENNIFAPVVSEHNQRETDVAPDKTDAELLHEARKQIDEDRMRINKLELDLKKAAGGANNYLLLTAALNDLVRKIVVDMAAEPDFLSDVVDGVVNQLDFGDIADEITNTRTFENNISDYVNNKIDDMEFSVEVRR